MALTIFFVLMAVIGAVLSCWGIFSVPFDDEMLLGGIIFLSIGFVAIVVILIISIVIDKKRIEQEDEDLLKRFRREKTIALCTGLEKIERMSIIQSEIEYEMLERRARVADDYIKHFVPKNTHSSALWGGAVAGVFGLGAGLYTAVGVEEKNQKIREENERNMKMACDVYFSSRLELLTGNKRDWKSIKELSLEMGASFEKPINTLASFITVEKPIVKNLDNGMLEITASWTCGRRNNYIDGSYKVSLYDENNNLVGGAFLPLPLDGTRGGSGRLCGICPAIKGKYHHAVIEPFDLWEIVTPRQACKRYFDEQLIKEKKEDFVKAITIDRTKVKSAPPAIQGLLFIVLGIGIALGIAIGSCAGAVLSGNGGERPSGGINGEIEWSSETQTIESVEGNSITIEIYRNNDTEGRVKYVFKGEGTVGYDSLPYGMDTRDGSIDVVFAEGITGLAEDVFGFKRDCVASVTIGKSVRSIDINAFSKCENISQITYEGSFEDWLNIERIATKNLYFSTTEYELIIDGKSIREELVIPGTVTKIPDYAFSKCKIEALTIMNGVKEIGKGAFSYCRSLKRVEIPDSVEIVREEAMYCCQDISLLKIGGGIRLIEKWGLNTASRVEITNLANWCSVEMSLSGSPIGDASSVYFDGVSAEKIVIPDGVETISKNAFYIYRFEVEEIYIPDSVKYIEEEAINSAYANAEDGTKLVIYCQASEKPSGWEERWYYSYDKDDMEKGYEVVWGYTEESE